MPNVLRSRLLALAFAACAFACLMAVFVASTTTAHAEGVRVTRERLGPPIPKRHILKRLRPRHRHKRPLGERAARIALKAVGVPYHWAYGHVGVPVPHSSYALAGMGRRVRHLRPGDLLFFSGYGHVGIYVGRGRMVHAPHSGTTVQVVRLGRSHYGDAVISARRLTRP